MIFFLQETVMKKLKDKSINSLAKNYTASLNILLAFFDMFFAPRFFVIFFASAFFIMGKRVVVCWFGVGISLYVYENLGDDPRAYRAYRKISYNTILFMYHDKLMATTTNVGLKISSRKKIIVREFLHRGKELYFLVPARSLSALQF